MILSESEKTKPQNSYAHLIFLYLPLVNLCLYSFDVTSQNLKSL